MTRLLTALAALAMLACTGEPSTAARPAAPSPSVRVGPPRCPHGSQWDGRECAWRRVTTEVRCPAGSRRQGEECVALEVRCPGGTTFDGEACVPNTPLPPSHPANSAAKPIARPPGPPPLPDEPPSSSAPAAGQARIVALAIGGTCRFALDGHLEPDFKASIKWSVSPGPHRVDCHTRDGQLQSQTVIANESRPAAASFKVQPAPAPPPSPGNPAMPQGSGNLFNRR